MKRVQDNRFSPTRFLLSPQITISSANIIVHGDFYLSSATCSSPQQTRGSELNLDAVPPPLELLCHTYSTPHHCLTALINVLHHSNILLCYSRLLNTTAPL
ncbi:hypothetical protein XENORESO_005756 [Xenotaenia resolanae]|uniref:Uncharacterized protein n=1 Tax=Xenotaenia resolanae TaxID=208358 RepID=A0ABV0W1M1_9TELE